MILKVIECDHLIENLAGTARARVRLRVKVRGIGLGAHSEAHGGCRELQRWPLQLGIRLGLGFGLGSSADPSIRKLLSTKPYPLSP